MSDSAVDLYGVPEFFINCVSTEDAGNGNVRVFNYTKRGELLVAQFTVVIAAADLIVASRRVEFAAEAAFVSQQWSGLSAH